MKNSLAKKTFLILVILIGFTATYGIYMSQLEGEAFLDATKQEESYNQIAIPTVFATIQPLPVVTLNWVHAEPKLLRLNLTLSGLKLVSNTDDLENIVCNPYINPDEPISLTLNYREAEIPEEPGEPIVITYEYSMNADGYKTITFNLDLTLGPCADYLNFQETNVTPSSPLPDLIANYRLKFQVPIQ